ncbi:HD-GYP domain-containing protein [Geosporobacter ferrireducens]|uniref:HD-GYP domain-containing protein n=1 Tax=Geosporobacter ferrireducens TaxID=1424294 RepID=A0A1D8GFF9_9FIRM|nr:HD domain-containing phosphohydrolase [Geosporobacter ferrireducens]AOT69640.1 hypothetical protein Gferi_08650 [Geosporobacter ferrireducens]MTI54656.1 HD domain-containing protein [Geosporobacter ferrireducens]
MEWAIKGQSELLHMNSSVVKHNFSLEIFVHSKNVGNIALRIGEKIKLEQIEKQKLYEAALLHDIGKSKIPQSILYKEGKLSSEEWEIMKKHAVYSEELFLSMVYKSKQNIEIGEIVRYHHENWDGSGYPENKAGEAIPLNSRIIRIADIFDAITRPRVYRPFKIKNTMKLMENMKGREIDPYIFDRSYNLLKDLLEDTYSKNTKSWRESKEIE